MIIECIRIRIMYINTLPYFFNRTKLSLEHISIFIRQNARCDEMVKNVFV